MSIVLQAFYWDCPHHESEPGQWWHYLDRRLDAVSRLAPRYIWLPPFSKSCQGQEHDAMGYDAFDYYDLGDYLQKDTRRTLFGNHAELENLIRHIHARGMQVWGELCFSHCRGGEREINPYTGGYTDTLFEVKSGRFLRNYEDFTPCRYDKSPNNSPWKHLGAYDYCYTSPRVYEEFLKYAAWLHEELQVDGFRFDNVKAYPSFIPRAIQRYLGVQAVGEYWDEQPAISRWLAEMDYSALAWDFPLRGRLAEMCNQSDYDLRSLWGQGLVFEHPHHTVTFAENHDTERDGCIRQDKLLAYALILTLEGLPTVFWKDYFTEGLALEGSYHGIERLAGVHHKYAGGRLELLYLSADMLVYQRSGDQQHSGLILVLNLSDRWQGAWVGCRWMDTTLVPAAWWGRDLARPVDKHSYQDGSVELYAPPRGYAVYVPGWADSIQRS